MAFYKAGLSYKKAGEIAGGSHEAIREWCQKGRELFEPTPLKRPSKAIKREEGDSHR
jgi:hypothetical protein